MDSIPSDGENVKCGFCQFPQKVRDQAITKIDIAIYAPSSPDFAGCLPQEPPARPCQFVQGAAWKHLAQGGHGLYAAHIGPLALRDGVEPEDLPRLTAGLQQGPGGPGDVDGLCVGEDEQGGGGAQGPGAAADLPDTSVTVPVVSCVSVAQPSVNPAR